jgi:hypothetical protein
MIMQDKRKDFGTERVVFLCHYENENKSRCDRKLDGVYQGYSFQQPIGYVNFLL